MTRAVREAVGTMAATMMAIADFLAATPTATSMVIMVMVVAAEVAMVDDLLTGVAGEVVVVVGHQVDVEVVGALEAAEATGRTTPSFRT